MTSENSNGKIYQQVLAESVHHSLKITNSNIKGGGIRVSNSAHLDLPYISVRTLLNENILIPVTYHTNSGNTATLFKVINAVQLNEDTSTLDEEFQQNVFTLRPQFQKVFSKSFSCGLNTIDIRMRQLLIPYNNGKYISISPLAAPGLNLVLNEKLEAIKELRKVEGKDSKLKNIKSAVFGIGGSNVQNCGTPPLMRAIQRPIVLGSPTLDPKTRLAFQYFYKGFDYIISNRFINQELYQELTTYAVSLIEQQKLSSELGFHDYGIQAPFSNMKTRAAELSTIKKIIDDVLLQGQDILKILKSIDDQLPNFKALERKSFWSHPRVPVLAQGLINPELQQFEDWQKLFADDLASKITKHQYWKKEIKNNVGISLSEADAKNFLSRHIQELLK